MRQVIAAAEVGDAVFGLDPSVHQLEKVAAERLGKPAALYVPSYVQITDDKCLLASANRLVYHQWYHVKLDCNWHTLPTRRRGYLR